MLESISDVMDRMNEIQSKISGFYGMGQPPKTEQSEGADFKSMMDGGMKNISSIIDDKAQKFSMDSNLIKSVIKVESNGDAKAVSSKGAKGLMQLMPTTAADLGVTDVFDEEQNVEGGTKYLKALMDKYNDLPKALAAYNAGPGEVDKQNSIPNFKETQDYVKKVLETYNSLKEKK